MKFALTILLLVSVGLIRGCSRPADSKPQLYFDTTVAADFRALADETWTLFVTTFGTRSNCFGGVTLSTDSELENRAVYDPETATVTIRVPGTSAFLQAALLHEWAHHVEFQCNEHKALQPLIIAALNLPNDTSWRIGHDWEDSPAEQYAEAVVELVLGDHPLPTKIRVDRDVVELLDLWLEEK